MADYQCMKCGTIITGQSGTPYPKSLGSCPETTTGNHIWQRLSRFFKVLIPY